VQKTCVGLQEKRFRAPAPPLLVAALAAVAARGPAAAGLVAGVAAGSAARGPACPVWLLVRWHPRGPRRQLQPAALLPLGWGSLRRQQRSGIPSGGSAGVRLSWEAGDCSCLVCKQETKAVTRVGIFVHLRLSDDGSATVAGVGDGSAAAAGMTGCSSRELGVTCGCLSSVEDGVEAAGVGWLDGPGLIVTCSSLSSVEDGVEAAGVSGTGMGCEGFTCGCLSSAEDGVEAAGVSMGWIGSEDVTCGCLPSVEDGVGAAGGRTPVMARAGMAVQFGSLLP
jgi:hypothetical protein